MKKLILFSIAFIFLAMLSSPRQNFSTYADSPKQYYAKIQADEVYFFDQPNDSDEFKKFKLPTSYFVLLTADANNNFYSCKYGDLNGYIKKSEVTPMSGTPVTPYANFASFRVFALDGLDMRSTPYKTPLNVIKRVNYLEDNLIYYGSIDGDQLIPKKTKTWYYCKFVSTESSEFGYLYSALCDELTQIPLNLEVFDKIEGELFPLPSPTPTPSTSLSGTAKTLIIVGVSLPCVLIIYLLIKPTLISETNSKSKKSKSRKRKRHGDYFEFDEHDLT